MARQSAGTQMENGVNQRLSKGNGPWTPVQPFRSEYNNLSQRRLHPTGSRQLLVMDTLIDLGTYI
jgi:hypothetical protein